MRRALQGVKGPIDAPLVTPCASIPFWATTASGTDDEEGEDSDSEETAPEEIVAAASVEEIAAPEVAEVAETDETPKE